MSPIALILVVLSPLGLADDPPLAPRIAELKQRFEERHRYFRDEQRAANKLEGDARRKKLADLNRAYEGDWRALAEELTRLVETHPDDPAALEGMIVLVNTLGWPLSESHMKAVRAHHFNDPRMGRLCACLAYRNDLGIRELLADAADKHPDRAVRGQAAYALGVYWRNEAEAPVFPRDPKEIEHGLAEAKKHFERAAHEFDDVTSADGRFGIGAHARAELARLANLPNLKVGKLAPEIEGEDLDGKPLRLSDHRGKVVVVCFWATWCGPCMAMVPHERELAARMQGKPFALLGVNSDAPEDREKAKSTTIEQQMTWPSWWDGNTSGPIQTAYDVQHWPTIYVIDPAGTIRYIDVRGEALDRAVDALLVEMGQR